MYFYGARVQAIFFLRAQLLELHKNVFEKRHKDVVRNEERIFFGGKAEFLGIQNRHRAQVFSINFACKFAKKGRLITSKYTRHTRPSYGVIGTA